jgi:DNA polymerase III delta subunit
MLYVFHGNSPTRVRALAYKKALPFEEEGLHLERIDGDSYTQGLITEAAQSATLFGEKLLFFIDTPSSESAFNEEVLASLEGLAQSVNIFIIVEESLLAAPKKQYGKYAAEVEEIKEEKGREFNVFALADSLSRKDKKMLWIGLCEAKDAGLSAEELIGTLWWQLKTLRLASMTKTAGEADMKDFPYNKAKRSLATFKEGELERISQSLLALYHEGHQGEVDIDLALEKWALSL